MYSLRIENDKGEIRRIDVDKDVYSIGRLKQNDLVLSDINVSRRHAVLEVRAEGLVLVDPGSKYGIRMNSTQNPPEVLLHGGDTFVLGDYKIELIPSESEVLPGASATIRMTSLNEKDVQEPVAAEKGDVAPSGAAVLIEDAVGVPYTVAVSEDESLRVLLEMRKRSLSGAGHKTDGHEADGFSLDPSVAEERRTAVRRSLLIALMLAATLLIAWFLYSYWASSEVYLGILDRQASQICHVVGDVFGPGGRTA